MGIIFEERGKFEQAKAYYELAIKLNPNHHNAQLNLSDILTEQQMDLNDAITDNENQKNMTPVK